MTSGTIGINSVSNLISDKYSLNQNYPNPFNPNTIINYNIGKSGFVKLTVYNSIGKEISVLVNGKQNKGNYEINFIADNYPAGLYFYKLETDAFTSTKKMLLLK
ncbi:MAG: T9SS type A sorting domain-containing protein [Ignavibacteria bacterium]|nr:T9SS type A sorting domain-containing protein [Ignavibacteria bacterium]